MKPTEKKQLVAKLIAKYVQNGMDITELLEKPLCDLNEDKIKNLLENKYFFKC